MTHPFHGLRHLCAVALRQGRYQAILLDGDAVAAVCHYIHLNPVRAGLIEAARLQEYKDSSFHQLWYPRKRWGFTECGSCLEAAGGLADKPKGRALYRDYLEWLSADDPERKRLGFEKMSRGWAKGCNAFKKAVLRDLEAGDQRSIVEAEASEMREPRWENGLKQALRLLGKGESDLLSGRKGADWKVALARHLRERYLAPHKWIAQRLSMGQVSSVNSLVSRHRKLKSDSDPDWGELENQQYLD